MNMDIQIKYVIMSIGCGTNELSNHWVVGPMGYRTNGLSDQCAVEPQGSYCLRSSMITLQYSKPKIKVRNLKEENAYFENHLLGPNRLTQ